MKIGQKYKSGLINHKTGKPIILTWTKDSAKIRRAARESAANLIRVFGQKSSDKNIL